MAETKDRLYIGTSGWTYKHWKSRFYPPGVPERKWLEYYAQHFNTVELNASFYRLPKETTVLNWNKRVPEYFRFTVKGSRTITHLLKLKNCEESLELFYGRFFPLREKIALVLFQFPPSLHLDLVLLKDFISLLSPDFVHVFEFRHKSWYVDDTLRLLERSGVHFCISDYPNRESPEICAGNTVYFRFHGFRKRYGGYYPREYLSQVAAKIGKWISEGKKVFAYFNNDAEGFAVKNAKELKEICDAKLDSLSLPDHS